MNTFADYKLQPTSVIPSVKPYKVEPGLANVANAKDFKLSPPVQALIDEKNAFAARSKGSFDASFGKYYRELDFSSTPVFVTTDSVSWYSRSGASTASSSLFNRPTTG